MSLKEELEIWTAALEAYDGQEFERCLDLFETIAISSKILFNIGLVQATIGSHELAVRNFEAAIQLDEYLAIAFFQAGVSEFLLGKYSAAYQSFNTAYQLLRDNLTIDYDQLGLKFRLFSCEILFNRGLSAIYMGKNEQGLSDLDHARREKQTRDHSVIDEALADGGNGYTVFSIPVGMLFKPNSNKIKNLKKKDYLGTARVVAATDISDTTTGFSGHHRQASTPIPVFRPVELARSKTTGARFQGSDPAAPIQPNEQSLRRAATEVKAVPPLVSRGPAVPTKSTELGRSNTVGGNPGPRTRPPTPPSSTEQDRKQKLNTSKSYDADLIDDYYDSTLHPSSGQPSERVEHWARETIRDPPSNELLRSLSNSTRGSGRNVLGAMTAVSPSLGALRRGGGGSINRGIGSVRRVVFDDGYEEALVEDREMNKIRIKLRYQDDTRGMSIPILSHTEFVNQVKKKLNLSRLITLQYMDTEYELISIVDEGDWESAIDQAREAAQGKAEGKLEIHLS